MYLSAEKAWKVFFASTISAGIFDLGQFKDLKKAAFSFESSCRANVFCSSISRVRFLLPRFSNGKWWLTILARFPAPTASPLLSPIKFCLGWETKSSLSKFYLRLKKLTKCFTYFDILLHVLLLCWICNWIFSSVGNIRSVLSLKFACVKHTARKSF